MNEVKRPISKKPIPEDATKIFDGVLFEVYQWQQKIFDGTYATFEKVKRITDSVNILPITIGYKIILTKQEQPGMTPFIGVLGGMIDKGEYPLQAVERELLEESGYKANRLESLFAMHPMEKVDWVIYTFIARDLKKIAKLNLDNGEKIELIEYTFEEFLELIVQDNFRDQELALYVLKNTRTHEDKKLFKEKLFGKRNI